MRGLIIILLALLLMTIAYAHPGRTNEEGCHYCRTNCQDYGLEQDEYHCHVDESSTSSIDTTTSSTKKTSSTTTTKKTTSTTTTSTTTSIMEELDNIIKVQDDEEIVMEKDIYDEKNEAIIEYESDDYKARRMALYFFNFILILVIIKLMIRR